MQFKSLFVSVVVSVLISVAVSFAVIRFYSAEKIGFVRSGEVLKSYVGLKAAQKQFEQEYKIAKGNSDTLLKRVELLKNNQQLKRKSLSNWTQQVREAENNFLQYQKTADEQLKVRQGELSGDAISKLNFFIEDYGKSHGYKYILGSTDNGNILYGKPADDITKEILEGLNKSLQDKNSAAKN